MLLIDKKTGEKKFTHEENKIIWKLGMKECISCGMIRGEIYSECYC